MTSYSIKIKSDYDQYAKNHLGRERNLGRDLGEPLRKLQSGIPCLDHIQTTQGGKHPFVRTLLLAPTQLLNDPYMQISL